MTGTFRRVEDAVGELRRDRRTPILITVAIGWFLSLGVRLIYPAIIPHLRTAYGISLSTAGLLLTALWLAYAIGQLPGGILSDRFGERAVLVTSTFVSGAVVGLIVVANVVELLFAATVLFGLSTALYGVARFTILSNVYPENDGTAIAVTMAAGDLGNSLLPPFAGFLAVTFAWQFGFAFAVPLFLLASVGLYLKIPRPDAAADASSGDRAGGDASPGDGSDSASSPGASSPGASSPAASSPGATSSADRGRVERAIGTVRDVGSALRSRPVIVVTGIQTLGYCGWQSFTGFYPTYLIDVKGLAPTTATLLFGLFFGMGAVVKPLTGRAYDVYGIRRTLPAVLVVAGGSLASLPFVASLPGLALLTVCLSTLLGYAAATLPYLTAALPSSVQGSGLGMLRTGYMIVGAASPVVAGTLADAGHFDEVFLLLSGLVLVAGLCCLLLPRASSAP